MTDDRIMSLYWMAKEFVETFFPRDIEFYESIPPLEQITFRDFLNQYTWVILNSGMSFKTVDKKWPAIRKALFNFNPKAILAQRYNTFLRGTQVWGYRGKILAVIEVTFDIQQKGWTIFREAIKHHPKEVLLELKYIGPVNVYHLMKNLGFDEIKLDRHLVRVGEYFDQDPLRVCKLIQEYSGDKLAVIDVILWRYCEQGLFPPKSGSDNTLEAFI